MTCGDRRDRVWIVGRLADAQSGRWAREGECGDARQSVALGRDAGVADSHGHGREGERRSGLLDGERTACGHDADRCDDAPVAHTHDDQPHVGSGEIRAPDSGEESWWSEPRSRGCDLADGDAAGLEGRRLCGYERAHQWPAGPGSPPHEWEQSRTVESPVGRRAHGVSARLASARWRNELRALGNAVCPQVVEVIGRAILAVDAA